MTRELSDMICFKDVSFRYPGREEDTIRGVSFSMKRGEVVLMTGKTGCGKSTLLKMLNGIIPHESAGRMKGAVTVDGTVTLESSIPELARLAGIVFQTPDDQLFCSTVYDELAFGPENLGLKRDEIDRRVAGALKSVGLPGFEGRRSTDLSGGQKQRVAIASQLTLGSKIIALDEPISQLDPAGAREVMECLAELKESGITVLIAEHRIPEVLRIADRIIVVEKGSILLDIPRSELPGNSGVFLEMGLKLPAEILISTALKFEVADDWRGSVVRELKGLGGFHLLGSDFNGKIGNGITGNEVILSLEGVSYSYGGGVRAVEDVSLAVRRGDIIAVMGHNGCGKSTLMGLIAGLMRCGSGKIAMPSKAAGRGRAPGAVGMVFQNPDLQLIEESVDAELNYGPANVKMDRKKAAALVGEIKEMLGLAAMGGVPPHSLSKGQRLRTVIGAALALMPSVLVLDEPTTGQNIRNIRRLVDTIRSSRQIEAIIFSTHDVETAALYASRVVLMKGGRIIADAAPPSVLADAELMKSTELHLPEMAEISLECGIIPPAITFTDMMKVVGAGA